MIPLSRIHEIAAARGGQPAIISNQGTLTWYEFAGQVAGFINSLSGMTNPHELRTLSVISQNRPDLVVAAAAAATLRLTYTGLDYSLGADVLGRLIDESESDCLIVSSRLLAQKQILVPCRRTAVDRPRRPSRQRHSLPQERKTQRLPCRPFPGAGNTAIPCDFVYLRHDGKAEAGPAHGAVRFPPFCLFHDTLRFLRGGSPPRYHPALSCRR